MLSEAVLIYCVSLFMIYLSLLCGRPEVLQADYSFEVFKVAPFRVQG